MQPTATSAIRRSIDQQGHVPVCVTFLDWAYPAAAASHIPPHAETSDSANNDDDTGSNDALDSSRGQAGAVEAQPGPLLPANLVGLQAAARLRSLG